MNSVVGKKRARSAVASAIEGPHAHDDHPPRTPFAAPPVHGDSGAFGPTLGFPPPVRYPPRVVTPAWSLAVFAAVDRAPSARAADATATARHRQLSRELARLFESSTQHDEKSKAEAAMSREKVAKSVSGMVAAFWKRASDVRAQITQLEAKAEERRQALQRQDDLVAESKQLLTRLVDSLMTRPTRSGKDGHGGGRGHTDKARGASAPDDTVAAKRDDMLRSAMRDIDAPQQPQEPGGESATGPHASSASAGWDAAETVRTLPPLPPLRLLDTQGGARALRSYQDLGLRWLVNLFSNGVNAILADEMGLGKTIQAIALLAYFAEHRRDWGPHLVVVPTTVVHNWASEFRMWAPGMKFITYIGTREERRKLRVGWTKPGAIHVVITSYNIAVIERNVFRRRPWGFLILDEAHMMKNSESQRFQMLFDFPSQYRLLLSGTPLQNSVMELWSLLKFIMPQAEAFESSDDFQAWFASPLEGMAAGRERIDRHLIQRLHALLRPFVLRRLKCDVESQLPKKTEYVVDCTMSIRQQAMYRDVIKRTDALLRWRGRTGGGGIAGAMSVLLTLRKVCDHPNLVAEPVVRSPVDLVMFPIVERVPACVVFQTAAPASFVEDWSHTAVAPCVNRGLTKYDDDSLYRPGSAESLRSDQDTRRVFEWCRDGGLHRLLTTTLTRFISAVGSAFFSRAATSVSHVEHGAVIARNPNMILFERQRKTNPRDRRRQTEAHSGRVLSLAAEPQEARQAILSPSTAPTPLAPQLLSFLLSTPCRRACNQTWANLNRVFHDDLPSRSLAPTLRERVEGAIETIRRLILFVPRVRATEPPRVVTILPMRPVPGRAMLPGTMENCVVGEGARFFLSQYARNWLRELTSTSSSTSNDGDGDRGPFAMWTELDPLHSVGTSRCVQLPPYSDIVPDSGKLQILVALIRKRRAEGHRAIIFTQFNAMLDLLEKTFAHCGITYVRMDGATKPLLRQAMADGFNQPTSKVTAMLLSTRAGGIGLNLVGADTVVFYDTDWNPAIDLQAQDRCHRIGQTRSVTIFRLITKGTVEDGILKVARQRKAVNNVVMRGGGFHDVAAGIGTDDGLLSSSSSSSIGKGVEVLSFFHDLDEDADVGAAHVGGGRPSIAGALAAAEDEADRVVGESTDDHMASGDQKEVISGLNCGEGDDRHGVPTTAVGAPQEQQATIVMGRIMGSDVGAWLLRRTMV